LSRINLEVWERWTRRTVEEHREQGGEKNVLENQFIKKYDNLNI